MEEVRDGRDDVRAEREVERVRRDPGPARVDHVRTSSLSARSGPSDGSPGPAVPAPPVAAVVSARTSRPNSSSNCGRRCSAKPPTLSTLPVADPAAGSAVTQTLRREV